MTLPPISRYKLLPCITRTFKLPWFFALLLSVSARVAAREGMMNPNKNFVLHVLSNQRSLEEDPVSSKPGYHRSCNGINI